MTRLRWTLLFSLLLPALFGAAEATPPAAADPHQQLDDILNRPIYQRWQLRQKADEYHADPALLEGYRRRIRQIGSAIGDFIEWLFRRSARSPSASRSPNMSFLPAVLKAVAWTAVVLAVIFIGVLLFRYIRGVERPGTMARVLSRTQIHEAMQAGDALALDSQQWVGEAQRLAAEKDFRAVYRALYLALLCGLHKLGKIDFNRNRTNWSYVHRYRGPDEERTTFTRLTDLFDHVWYGLKDAQHHDLDQLHRQVASLTAAGGQQ